MAVVSKAIVVDASIARAASGVSEGGSVTGTAAREFLQDMLTICHKMVMNDEILREWKRHESSFSKKWRRGMIGKKKLVVVKAQEDSALRTGIDTAINGVGRRKAALKDVHLLEAAFASDRRIASMDDKARALFHEASQNVPVIKQLAWVNPVADAEQALLWLRNGAPKSSSTVL